MSGGGESKSIGISLKDRSAILPVGRSADGAYWFDENSGSFVSSSYYFEDVPAWVKDFNQSRFTNQYLGMEWTPLKGGKPFLRMDPAPGAGFFKEFERSAFGNELLEAFAERVIEAEQLGRHSGTDVLAVSFSSNDYVGHDHGPDSPQVHDISIRTDRVLGALFQFVDSKVGLNKTLIVLTADHGVAPMPEAQKSRRMSGGRIPEDIVVKKAQAVCEAAYGPGKWVVGESGPSPYLNLALIREKGLRVVDVEETVAAAVRSIPHVARVYTRSQLLAGSVNSDAVARRVANGFHPQRSANLLVMPEPFWLFEDKGTSHGTPYHYDTHVPIVFMGPGIKSGWYRKRAAVNDIAPTLAAILEIEAPSGSAGRVLDEALDSR
jgi:predicted AlkP superfamily pyrophosphatase or phosphodiesterase